MKNQLVSRLVKALKAEADPSANGEPDDVEDVEMAESEVASQETPAPNVEETSQEKKDEAETEMNIAEMDMSEVTIIDEYDSTKCDDEKPREKKKEEPRKLDEKERHQSPQQNQHERTGSERLLLITGKGVFPWSFGADAYKPARTSFIQPGQCDGDRETDYDKQKYSAHDGLG